MGMILGAFMFRKIKDRLGFLVRTPFLLYSFFFFLPFFHKLELSKEDREEAKGGKHPN